MNVLWVQPNKLNNFSEIIFLATFWHGNNKKTFLMNFPAGKMKNTTMENDSGYVLPGLGWKQ